MDGYRLTKELIDAYGNYLFSEERSKNTVEKYKRDTISFLLWLGDCPVSKEAVAEWKAYLLQKGYNPVTINAKISALNGLFDFCGWSECKVRFLKIQRKIFCDNSRELSQNEYEKLLLTAKKQGNERLFMLMETICSTGIRVSEIQYITLEAVRRKKAEIALKGKIRVILLPDKLCYKLMKYAQKNNISCGEIFLTRNGKSISRKQIWAEMKNVCSKAGIETSKVFPHNLRHLFARTFYRVCRDVTKLADVLGHSSVETTRIYLISTGMEHAKTLDLMRLVL